MQKFQKNLMSGSPDFASRTDGRTHRRTHADRSYFQGPFAALPGVTENMNLKQKSVMQEFLLNFHMAQRRPFINV